MHRRNKGVKDRIKAEGGIYWSYRHFWVRRGSDGEPQFFFGEAPGGQWRWFINARMHEEAKYFLTHGDV